MKCSICKKVFEGEFYDPFPVLKNGVCCKSCRFGIVRDKRALFEFEKGMLKIKKMADHFSKQMAKIEKNRKK